MKDRSKLVTLVALIALAFAFASTEGTFPGLEALEESMFWVIFGVLLFFLIRGNCCRKKAEQE
jgi:choline-glycine betaine transporter